MSPSGSCDGLHSLSFTVISPPALLPAPGASVTACAICPALRCYGWVWVILETYSGLFIYPRSWAAHWLHPCQPESLWIPHNGPPAVSRRGFCPPVPLYCATLGQRTHLVGRRPIRLSCGRLVRGCSVLIMQTAASLPVDALHFSNAIVPQPLFICHGDRNDSLLWYPPILQRAAHFPAYARAGRAGWLGRNSLLPGGSLVRRPIRQPRPLVHQHSSLPIASR